MSAALGLLLCAALGLGLGLGAAWAVGAAALPLWLRALARWPGLARFSPLVAAAPVAVGAAVALGALLSGDAHLGLDLRCHCAQSAPGWLHLCPLHPAGAVRALPVAVGLLAALGPPRLAALRALLAEPRGDGGPPAVVELPAPVALLHGWWRPSVVVDAGLWGALDADGRAVVMAHEAAHLRRRDPAVLWALRLLLVPAPPGPARAVAAAWLQAAERAADAAAARAAGGGARVAEVLLRCARVARPAGGLALGWTGGGLEARVRALLALPAGAAADDRPPVHLLLGLLAPALALAAAPWVHHQLEHLLNLHLGPHP